MGLHRLRVADKKKVTQSLPDKQVRIDFQGESAVLRIAFFPAIVDIHDPLLLGFLQKPVQHISNTDRTRE